MVNGYESVRMEENHEDTRERNQLVDSLANGSEEITSSRPPKTTTIGTIALQSGYTRVVIALLQSGERLRLKVLEIQPELTKLSDSPEEATELSNTHDEVLLRLQSEQSPVEEFLRQADRLISTQRPKTEVYEAMAKTLADAWRDVNSLLERRKQILDRNVLFQCRAEECKESMRALEMACNDTLLPIEIEAVKNFLGKIHDLRKVMLESLMGALQEEKILLDQLKEISNEGTLDSRPDRIKTDADHAILQVGTWLEGLHDRRRLIEVSFNRRKNQLEQCLALALLATDLRNLEDVLNVRIASLSITSDHLGDSSASAELLLFECRKIRNEAKDFQDRAIKMTKSTERLVSSGHFAGEQATEQAYSILGAVADYINDLDQYETLLNRVLAFFEASRSTLTKMDQLEIRLVATNHSPHSPSYANLHVQAVETLEDITRGPLAEGHALLEITGRGAPGAEGLRRKVKEIEDRKIRVLENCTTHKEKNVRVSQFLNHFLHKYQSLCTWLDSIVESGFRGHQDMGSDLETAKDFSQLHCQLLSDLEKKNFEIQMIDQDILQENILTYLETSEQQDIYEKIKALHNSWLLSKKSLEARIKISSFYVEFHQAAANLERELDSLETDLKSNVKNLDHAKMTELEQRWETLQPYYVKLTATGNTFLDEGEKITDSYLDVSRACLCVETTLERFSNRQFATTRTWENWQTTITNIKEKYVERENRLEESTRTLEWISKFREQLYPVITSESSKCSTIFEVLESSRVRILPELNKAVSELDERIKGLDAFEQRGDSTDQQIINQLSQVLENLRSTALDYQSLLESLISIFGNLTQIEQKVDQKIRIQDTSYLTNPPKEAVHKVKVELQYHETELRSCTESIARVRSEIESVIFKIEKQESPEAAKKDIQRLKQTVHDVTTNWESSWSTEKSRLEKDLQLCLFREDVEVFDKELYDLIKQLKTISGWLGENLSSGKAASEAFVELSKTLVIIKNKVEGFIQSSEQNMSEDSTLIQQELTTLKEKLNLLKTQSNETRTSINLSIEYFQLLEETRDWFEDGSKLLIIIARKTSTIRVPLEAIELLNDIERFLKPGEDIQEKRIERVRELSTRIFGTDRLTQFNEVVVENREMLDSFAVVSSELRTLAENLKNAELLHEKLKIEQDEANAKLEEAKKEANAAQVAAAEAENVRRIVERLAGETLERAAEEAKCLIKMEAKDNNEKEKSPLVADAAQTETTNLIDEHLVKETIMKETSAITTEKIHILEKTEIQKVVPIMQQKSIVQETTIVNEKVIKKREVEPQLRKDISIPESQSNTLSVLIAPQFTVTLNDATIQEGEKFTFVCQVIGNPEPDVCWYKDSISLINNPDYLRDYKRGICTLTIEETFTEDSATFSCKAFNDLGVAQTDAILSVKESAPDEQPSPPHFIKKLQSSVTNEGSTHRLECIVEGNPLPTVLWFKNDVNIDNFPDYVITYNNGEAILKLEEVFLDDQAIYWCKATNRLGQASTSCSLTVNPAQDAKSQQTGEANIILTGEKMNLDCEASENPTPLLFLTNDGKSIEEITAPQIRMGGRTSSLIITEAFLKDTGSNAVSARNPDREAIVHCNVSVKGRLPTNETGDSEPLCSDMEPKVPSIQLPLKDLQIKEGESARLDCIIVGYPEPEVIWYHDDRPVKESADFQLLFQGDKCSLLIHEAFLDDRGAYKVVAINSSGKASSECTLSVELRGSKHTPESPPVFVKLLSDLLVAEGEKSLFDCVITGEPKPEVKWYLNGDEIVQSDRIKVTQEDEGTNILLLTSTFSEDKGNYVAKATNRLGEAKAFARLVVRVLGDSQMKDEVVRMGEKLVAPSFKQRFDSKSVLERALVKFECIVTGKPAPKVQWLFNKLPVHGKDFLVSVSGERQVLTIPEVAKEHCGSVSCIAENAAGKAICSAKVEVGVGAQEEGFEIVQVPTIKMQASGSSEKHFTTEKTLGEGGSESQVLTKMSSSITESSTSHTSTKKEFISSSCSSTLGTSPGQPPTSFCVKKTTQSSEHATSQNEAPPVVKSQKIEEFERIFQDIPGEVKQERTVIITQDTELTKHVCKPCRKQTAPRFVSPVTGMIVDQGADVVFTGIVDGFPQPEVTWLKNCQELRTRDGVKMTYTQNHARLELKNVNVKDAGRYTCTAVNAIGSANSTADLVVKKTIFPPVFGRRLQAQVVKLGDRVIMEVEITGTPEPTVTWYKDDIPLIERPPEVRMRQQGNCYLLLIEKAKEANAGKYMVHATNAGGEAQSIADFAVFEPTPDTMIEVHKTLVYENVQDKDIVQETINPISRTEQWKSVSKPEKKLQPPPSPSKFVKSEFRKSDYESDFDNLISTPWKPHGADPTDRFLKPVKPNLKGTGEPRSASWTERTLPSPTPPVLIKTRQETTMKNFSAQGEKTKSKSVLLPGSPPEIAYAPPKPSKQTFNGSRTGAPFHNAVGTELRKTVRMDESTQNSRRIVTVEQTSRVIKFGETQADNSHGIPMDQHQQQHKSSYNVPVPKKFIQGQFKESDYESNIDAGKIKPKWTPVESDTEEARYRKVQPPRPGRPISIDGSQYSPMITWPSESENERSESEMRFSSTKERQNERVLEPGSPPEFCYTSGKQLRESANQVASAHMGDMTSSFKFKTGEFVHDIQLDLKKRSKPISKHSVHDAARDGDDEPRTFRKESRLSQYGTKHIDPDTGLIYFKYDFGYEFGILLPGEGKKTVSSSNKTIKGKRRASDIDVPIVHEFTSKNENGFSKPAPSIPTHYGRPANFEQDSFTPAKTVKWEPTSESEFSEAEDLKSSRKDGRKLQTPSPRWDPVTPSPVSLSPSLPSLSPRHSSACTGPPSNFDSSGSPWPYTNGVSAAKEVIQPYLEPQTKKAPLFITPLRDIAVLSGQTARFECIVQAEPQPNILWSKNGRIIENSANYEMYYRNGVCRLTLPRAFPDDAGTYTCTATNSLGWTGTTSTLQVPGNRRSLYAIN